MVFKLYGMCRQAQTIYLISFFKINNHEVLLLILVYYLRTADTAKFILNYQLIGYVISGTIFCTKLFKIVHRS